jgi:hypothetical protein
VTYDKIFIQTNERSKKMIFNGLQLQIGDLVAFTTSAVPLPEVHAAVIDVKDGVLEVMSTLIVPFQHSGMFNAGEVQEIAVIYPADVAIPQESRDKSFRRGERVDVTVRGEDGVMVQVSGDVVAAFDGIVVARRQDGQLITGGASHFNAVA